MAKDTKIELLSLKSLARTCKEKKAYSYLICSMCSTNKTLVGCVITHLRTYKKIRDINSNDNPFMPCKTQNDILTALYNLRHRNTSGDSSKSTQFRVMDCVNNLIHCCLERPIRDGERIETIGRESFENACKKIFGENFKDETTQAPMMGDNGNLRSIIDELNKAKESGDGVLVDKALNQFIEAIRKDDALRHNSNPWEWRTQTVDEGNDYDDDNDILPWNLPF